MRVGVPKETKDHEYRASTPEIGISAACINGGCAYIRGAFCCILHKNHR